MINEIEQAISVIQQEKKCVRRKIQTNCCDCAHCDLLLPDNVVLNGLDYAELALYEKLERKNNSLDKFEI